MVAAIVLMVVGFDLGTQSWLVDLVGALIVAVNLLRIFFTRSFLKSNGERNWSLWGVEIIVIANVLLWDILFTTAYLHDHFHGIASFLSLVLTMGFLVASAVSLSSSMWIAVSFQILTILPLVAVTLYLWFENGDENYLRFGGVALAFFVFGLRAAMTTRKDLVGLFRQEFELMITRKQLAEEQEKLIHSSRLASLGEMAGGLAHEINNPLAIIMLGIDSLEDSPKSDLAVEQRKSKVQTMKNAVGRINKIIRGLRHFSQQSESIPFEAVTVGSIIQETTDFLTGRLKKGGIKLEVIGDTEQIVEVRAVQLSQVLLNLLTNAIDAVSGSQAREVKVSIETDADWVFIDVSDSGTGLSEGMRERLFQPFATSKAPGQGMGLGLSISRGIMKEHGGDLSYLPNRPHTTFRMSIPRRQ